MRHEIQDNAKFAIIFGRGPALTLTRVLEAEVKSLPKLESTPSLEN